MYVCVYILDCFILFEDFKGIFEFVGNLLKIVDVMKK